MFEVNNLIRWIFISTITTLLCSCGADGIRDKAEMQLKSGQYETALKTYQDGLVKYPDNIVLRSGLISSRETAFAILTTSAATARSQGNDQLAETIIARALAINPNDDRAKAMQLDLARDRRQKEAFNQATDLVSKGLNERATIVIEAALKDNPKNADLISLQRQLELEDKKAELDTTNLKETRPVSLDFKDANLKMVLELLTRNSGINFVIDKDVRQDIRTTIFLKNTKLEDALELITTTNQLAFKILDSGTVLIYSKTPEKTKEYQDLVIRAFYLSSAEAKQTAQLLKSMLKIREPYVDEKLNMIVLRESPQTIRLAERLIALTDLSEPEVMLEIEVLEINGTSLTQIGVNYPDTLTLTPILPSTNNSTTTTSSNSNYSGLTLNSLRGLNNGNNIGINTPSLTINMHKDVSDSNILANPKIRARNHEKAKIMIGDKLPIVTVTGSSNNNGFLSESVQYVDVGLKLSVEPNIYLDDDVGIKLGLEVSSLVNTIKTAAGSTVYQIGTRNVDTVLKLHDGETQFLAGLISKSEQMSANRIPGIGDLPIIGRLFSTQGNNDQRSEIVLSITPHIIRNIRRPDINQAEFWSGTEDDIRSRPLILSKARKTTQENKTNAANPIPAPMGQAALNAANNNANGVEQPIGLELQLDAPKEVSVGQIFDIAVNIKTDKPIRGMPLQIQFNSNLLEILDADEGTFLNKDGTITSKSKTLEQNSGHASTAILRNGANDVSGEGTVMKFKFKSLGTGTAEVQITSAKAIAAMPYDILKLPEPLKITIK